MGACCVVETPWERRRRQMATGGLAIFLVLAIIGLYYIVYMNTRYATRVTIKNDVVEMDFKWKCRVCGSENEVKEKVR